ncbi:hypothetical protein Vadar_017657 [Vaccinium darrowii]|uniref:Uncharacterized protein n=1 Tax=Vaccinium darrowii TaxID=229202 RepID=A0ACB7YES5_9ERIC|nr:hypothetical protein Vadar_017657 [Vaccinium darrowii]
MRRLPTQLMSQNHVRLHLFSRYFTSPSSSPPPQPPQLLPLSKPSLSPPHPHHRQALSPPFSLSSRLFSSNPDPDQNPDQKDLALAQSLSSELLKDPTTDPLSITQRLNLNFSHVNLTPSLILQTLNISPDAGRTVLGFYNWATRKSDFKASDETVSYFVDYLGRRKDFKAAHNVLIDGRGVSGAKTLESAVDRLVRAGRPSQASFDIISIPVIVYCYDLSPYVGYLLKRVLSTKNEYGDTWLAMRNKLLLIYGEALSSNCTNLVQMIQVLFDVVPGIKFQDAIELISMQPMASTVSAWKRMQDIELMHMRYALEFTVLALGAMETFMIDETGSHHQFASCYLKDLRNHLEAVNNIPRKILMVNIIISLLHMDDLSINPTNCVSHGSHVS